MIEFLQKIQDLSFEEVNRVAIILLIVVVVIKIAYPVLSNHGISLFKGGKEDENELD